MAKLTPKQARFCEEYLVDLNATQAAIRAGYSVESAGSIGSENLTKPEIRARIETAMAERSKRTGINADRVLRELGRIAFVNPKDVLDLQTAEVKPDTSDDDLAVIAGMKVKYVPHKDFDENGDPVIEQAIEREVKLCDKLKALELCGRHLGMFKDNPEAKVFDQTFRRKIKSLGKGAIKSGIAWIQPYFRDGKLAFMRIPSTELVPLWRDAERTELDAFIRFYDQVIYIGTRKHIITHAEFWWPGGVKWFKTDAFAGTGAGNFYVDKEHGDEASDYTEPHFVVDNKPYNWEECPIAWLKYNEEELPLCYYIKDLIDDINWQTSVTSDVLRDVAKFIYILRNYGGQDLTEFLKDLKEHMAIKVTSDGGVDKLQADLNIDAVMAFLDKQRRDLFDFAAAVDTKDPDLGNASGTAINFRYMDLDADCDSLGTELKDTFRRLKLFIDVYFQITGQGDFTNEEFDIVFNMDLPVNETDIINNAVNSNGLLSKRTILQNHPWVTDVDEELARIDEEKKAAMEEYGDGLFNHAMGADDSQEGGDSAGLNGGDGNDE